MKEASVVRPVIYLLLAVLAVAALTAALLRRRPGDGGVVALAVTFRWTVVMMTFASVLLPAPGPGQVSPSTVAASAPIILAGLLFLSAGHLNRSGVDRDLQPALPADRAPARTWEPGMRAPAQRW